MCVSGLVGTAFTCVDARSMLLHLVLVRQTGGMQLLACASDGLHYGPAIRRFPFAVIMPWRSKF